MGSGVSIPDTLQDAAKQGFSEEQIKEFLEGQSKKTLQSLSSAEIAYFLHCNQLDAIIPIFEAIEMDGTMLSQVCYHEIYVLVLDTSFYARQYKDSKLKA